MLLLALCGSLLAQAESKPPAGDAAMLPRRSGVQDETYPGIDVIYDSVVDGNDRKLRLIVTRPTGADRPWPTVFLVGWLSCVSVEAGPADHGPLSTLFRAIVQTPGLVFVRLEKPGQGDSQGDCANTDFNAELAGYRAAFRALKRYAFVDPGKVFLLGISNGAGFAPLVAEGAPVRGYVVEGAWVKTWFEHMMEIERRRLSLSGKSAGEVNASMQAEAALYTDYLIAGESPAAIFKRRPEWSVLWDNADFQHQYGRPAAFYQQLQKLNLAEAWSSVRAPVLVLHGQYDWIMSRADHEMIAAIVNQTAPGAAQFIELPDMGHGFDTYRSMDEAFKDAGGPLNPDHARTIIQWLTAHQKD